MANFKIEAIFRAVDKITRPLKKISNRVSRFSRHAEKSLRKVDKVTSKLSKTIGKGLGIAFKTASAGALALGAATAKVIEVGAGFEKSLVSAAVKFSDGVEVGSEQFKKLEETARKTGATTEFSASQSAQALEYLALAGFDSEQAMSALPKVVDLATAANIDLATASDMATDSLGAMGLSSDDAATQAANLDRIMNVMAKTTTMANTDMTQLFEAFKAGGKTAQDAGTDLEEYSSLVGMLSNAGIKGEAAGTALRNMFLRLQAPVGKAGNLIKRYIGNITDAGTGKMKKMPELLNKLLKSMKKMDGPAKAGILNTIFGLRAIGPASLTMGVATEKFDDFTSKLRDAVKEGAATKMASQIRGTVSGSIDSLKSSIEGVLISLFKLDNEGIRGVIDGATEWVRANEGIISSKIGEYIEWLKDNFWEIVDVLKTVGIAIGVFGTLMVILKALIGVLTIVNMVTAANPMVLIITAIIIAVGAAVTYIIAHWDEIKVYFEAVADFIEAAWREVSEFLIEAFNFVVDAWERAIATIRGIFTDVRDFVMGVWDRIVEMFDNAVNYLVKYGPIKQLQAAFEWLKDTFDSVANFFSETWDFITKAFETAATKITEFFQPVIDLIETLIDLKNEVMSDLFGMDMSGSPEDIMRRAVSSPQMVSPQERTVSLFENRQMTTTQKTELTIRDESGRAQMTGGDTGANVNLKPTGTF